MCDCYCHFPPEVLQRKLREATRRLIQANTRRAELEMLAADRSKAMDHLGALLREARNTPTTPESPAPPPREDVRLPPGLGTPDAFAQSFHNEVAAVYAEDRVTLSEWIESRDRLWRAELQRLDGVIGDLERERAGHEADASRFPTLAEFSNLQDERDAERSRADAATKRAEEAEEAEFALRDANACVRVTLSRHDAALSRVETMRGLLREAVGVLRNTRALLKGEMGEGHDVDLIDALVADPRITAALEDTKGGG
jgi:hypothetical protein